MSETLILGVIALAFGIAAGYWSSKILAAKSARAIEEKAKSEYESAKLAARELIIEAKDKVASLIEEAKKEEREFKSKAHEAEERLLKKEELFERQVKDISAKETKVSEEAARLVAALQN